jgi:hypothetical protein
VARAKLAALRIGLRAAASAQRRADYVRIAIEELERHGEDLARVARGFAQAGRSFKP